MALIAALLEGRCVTVSQAAEYIWSGRASANRALAQLEAEGFIRRQFNCPVVGETLIRPTPKATAAMVHAGLAPREVGWKWKELYEVSPGFLQHETEVNEVRFRLIQACRATGGRVQLIRCESGPAVIDHFANGDGVQARLRPDRFIELALAGQRRQYFFIEIDRGTKPVRRSRGWDVVSQLRRYNDYRRSGRFGVRFATASHDEAFRVLFLTTTWERVDHIVSELHHSTNSDTPPYRAFSVRQEFLADPLGPVWQPEADGKRRRMIDSWPE